MSKRTLNRRDIARVISDATGFTIADIEEVLNAEEQAIAEAIAQGYSVKKHKLFRLDVETKAAKPHAYNGFAKEYYSIPEKKIVKFKPLKQLEDAIDKMNTEDEPDDDKN